MSDQPRVDRDLRDQLVRERNVAPYHYINDAERQDREAAREWLNENVFDWDLPEHEIQLASEGSGGGGYWDGSMPVRIHTFDGECNGYRSGNCLAGKPKSTNSCPSPGGGAAEDMCSVQRTALFGCEMSSSTVSHVPACTASGVAPAADLANMSLKNVLVPTSLAAPIPQYPPPSSYHTAVAIGLSLSSSTNARPV